jgi:peptide-methionine (S)-S-oxide reductase
VLADYDRALRERGKGPITTEVEDLPEYYLAEDYHQQYLHKVPNGYCGLAGTGVSCPLPGAFAVAPS